MKTVAFLPAHPAQLWVLRPVAAAVSEFARCLWILRDKDCLVTLADRLGLRYTVLSTAGRGVFGNSAELLANIVRAWRLTRREHIDLWVTKYGAGNIAARLARRRSIAFNDDDADIVPAIAATSYPFAEAVLVPRGVRMGRYQRRARRYRGTHELMYLHPDRFTPDPAVFGELGLPPDGRFAIVRLVSLQAHHDVGERGMSESFLRRLLDVVPAALRVFITSENPLASEFEPHRVPLPPERIHHALAFAEWFVGDSQTMTLEAAQLGTPALRLSSFTGRISIIEQMERHGLSFGFRPGQEAALLETLAGLSALDDRRAEFQRRRRAMLAEQSDPLPVFVGAIRALLEEPSGVRPAAWAVDGGTPP